MGNTSVQRGLFFTFRLLSLIRPGLRPVHLPRGGRLPPAGAPYLPLGEGAAAAAEEGWYRVGSGSRPTPVRASPCQPLPGEVFPLIRHAVRRATFPVGEGFLPTGSLTFPWGKVPPQRRKRGGTGLILGPAPHPSGLRPATLSQERVFPLIRPGLRPVHLPRRGRLPPAGALPYLSFGFSNIFSVYPLYESPIVL